MYGLKELLLRAPALTLAVAESMSCGRVQARIGQISGASQFFLGGITCYNIDQKVRHLGVNRVLAEAANGVSIAVAEQMAQGACQLFGAQIALATTGYAEPAPEFQVTAPRAWWALAHDLGDGRMMVQSSLVECPGANRVTAQETVAIAALNGLMRYLTTLRAGGAGP